MAEKSRLPEPLVARYGSEVLASPRSLQGESPQQLRDRIYLNVLATSMSPDVLNALAGRPDAHEAVTGREPSVVAGALQRAIPRERLFAVLMEIPPTEERKPRIGRPGTPNDRQDPPPRGDVAPGNDLPPRADPPPREDPARRANAPQQRAEASLRPAAADPGRVPIQFYVYGFKDVVLLARADGRPCTATFVHEEWVITAAHCVATWNPRHGRRLIDDWPDLRIYRVLEGPDSSWWDERGYVDAQALRRTPSLGISAVVVHDKWRFDPPYDVALIKVDLDPVGSRPRLARLTEQEVRDTRLTIAGYGDTTATRHPKGLEVGWQQSKLQDGLTHLGVGSGASNCLGDSGGPVFEGQQFGHADERHVLAAVISSKRVGPKSGPCAGTLGYAVRLDRVEMRQWVCRSTSDAVEGCRIRR